MRAEVITAAKPAVPATDVGAVNVPAPACTDATAMCSVAVDDPVPRPVVAAGPVSEEGECGGRLPLCLAALRAVAPPREEAQALAAAVVQQGRVHRELAERAFSAVHQEDEALPPFEDVRVSSTPRAPVGLPEGLEPAHSPTSVRHKIPGRGRARSS